MNIINEFNTEILDSNQGDKIRIVVVISEFRLWGMGLINVDFVAFLSYNFEKSCYPLLSTFPLTNWNIFNW